MPCNDCVPNGQLLQLFARDRTSGGPDANYDERYVIISESIKAVQNRIDLGGLTGFEGEATSDKEDGTIAVGGNITMICTPAGLTQWAPRILGLDSAGTNSAGVFTVWDPLPCFDLLIYRVARDTTTTATNDGVFEYTDCRVSAGEWTGTENGAIILSLDILGSTRSFDEKTSSAATALPASAAVYDGYDASEANTRPFMFHNMTLSAGGGPAALTTKNFKLRVDNKLQADYLNSQTATRICRSGKREMRLGINPQWTNNTATNVFLEAATNGSMTFTRANMSAAFTFEKLDAQWEDPSVGGPGQIEYDFEYMLLEDTPTYDPDTARASLVLTVDDDNS